MILTTASIKKHSLFIVHMFYAGKLDRLGEEATRPLDSVFTLSDAVMKQVRLTLKHMIVYYFTKNQEKHHANDLYRQTYADSLWHLEYCIESLRKENMKYGFDNPFFSSNWDLRSSIRIHYQKVF